MSRTKTFIVEVTFRETEADFEDEIIINDELLDYTSTLIIDMLEASGNITDRIDHIAVTSTETRKKYDLGQPYNLKNYK